MRLRTEAESRLASLGTDQRRPSDVRGRALDRWRSDIAFGRTWAVDDGRADPPATVTLGPPDADFWGEEDDPYDGVYVAKPITARRTAGRRLGGRLLDRAGTVARSRSLTWLCLDCRRTKTALQRYYADQGFTHVRTEHRRTASPAGWAGGGRGWCGIRTRRSRPGADRRGIRSCAGRRRPVNGPGPGGLRATGPGTEEGR